MCRVRKLEQAIVQHFIRLALLVGWIANGVTALADWPQFRGPDGQGHVPQGQLPLRWSEQQNLRWKVQIPGKGWSSPVCGEGQIWLTSATEEGQSLRALAVELASGKVLHDVELFRHNEPGPIHATNSYASPTPVLDNGRVYVHFGTAGTACLSTDGTVLWKQQSLAFRHPHAPGSSLVIHEERVLVTCDGTDVQFVVALDKYTGKVIWKQPRNHLEAAREKDKLEPPGRRGFPLMAYSTPLVVDAVGRTQLISTAADHVASYDVQDGEEIWWYPYDGFSVVARPILGNDCVFIVGFEDQSLPVMYAIRPTAVGQITNEQIVWTQRKNVSHVPSPLLIGDAIYVIGDEGVAACLDAATGAIVWKHRIGGNFSASPISVGDRIYLLSEEGQMTVLAADTRFHMLATNQLEGHFMASPAVAENALILRSASHLYNIEENADQ